MNPLVIAEAGINHNGSLLRAKKLVNASKSAKADIVKFQSFWDLERLRNYELSWWKTKSLKRYCDKKKIEFMSTPHTFEAIHLLDKIVDRFKIASPYLYNPNFLLEVAQYNKPIILSTGNYMADNGMATIDEIRNAVNLIENNYDCKITLMHCVSKYPCKEPHYERIPILKEEFGLPIGLSDHSKLFNVPKASIIEKHIKIDDNCIDEDVSLNPDDFRRLVEWVKR